jgi:protein gp37
MSKIEWTGQTWNPVTGCSPIASGCKYCYARRMHKRLRAMGQPKYQHDFSEVRCHPEELDKPLRWRKPRRVFVCSMSDLFHGDLSFEFILRVFEVMERARQHTFQLLTKRPYRVLQFCGKYGIGNDNEWPRNIWLGASASTQEDLERVVPDLLVTPAAVRFLSLEPLLGPITDLPLPCRVCGGKGWVQAPDHSREWCAGEQCRGIDWVIVGGESGPAARPMNPEWVRSIRKQCVEAGVPLFFKQWGEWAPDCIHPGDMDGDHKACRTTPRPQPGITGVMFRCGKARAGRQLDGRVWDQLPDAP